MTRLVRAELLKLRRRWATYVVLAVLLVIMALIYLLIGLTTHGDEGTGSSLVLHFPGAYGVINQFVFGIGSLLAVSYGAAIGGADWNWGVLRVIVARGEGRSRYVLAKFVGLGLTCFLGILVAVATGIALVLVSASLAGVDPGGPLAGNGAITVVRSIGYGSFVLLERVAIGFAVAVVLRSQVAGVVVGIVLYLGEGLLSTILTVMNARSLAGGFADENQWYQFLPFSIGNSVLDAASRSIGGDISSMFLPTVPLGLALAVTGLYLVLALAVAMLATERAEIA